MADNLKSAIWITVGLVLATGINALVGKHFLYVRFLLLTVQHRRI